MKVSTLQEFLRNLGETLSLIGIQPKQLDDLRAVAQLLDPFKDLTLEQLADFLRRAGELRHSGALPAIAVPGLDDATAAARTVSEAVVAFDSADETAAREMEARVIDGKRNLQTALAALAQGFGLGLKFTDDKKWIPALKSKAATMRVVDTIRRLAPSISGPESYQSESVKPIVDDLAARDMKALKAAAAELGVTGTGTGRKYVESLLVKLTGVDAKPARAPKKQKSPEAAATEEQVDAMTATLKELVNRAKDPNAVSEADIDAILTRVSTEFSKAQQRELAKRVTGTGGRTEKDARDRLRADLTAVKRLIESQNV